MTEIVEVKDFIPAYTDAVQKLLEQPICFSYWLIRKSREC